MLRLILLIHFVVWALWLVNKGNIKKNISYFQSCPWDTNLREMRIDCHLAMGETAKAITDLRATTKLISDNTESYLKLSKLHYLMGEGNESLK